MPTEPPDPGPPPGGVREFDSAACSIARTMGLIGRPWSVLILRDLFNGVRRFDELAQHLGVARNVLARRLAELVDSGLVERSVYREPGRRARHEYRLTAAGWGLRPVLLALMAYGDAHLAGADGPPLRLRHDGCDGDVTVQVQCAHGHPIGARDRLRPSPGPRPATGNTTARSPAAGAGAWGVR